MCVNSHSSVRETEGDRQTETDRRRMSVKEEEEKGRRAHEREKTEGERPSLYSQCCDMFVWGSSQIVCFHFTVWIHHLNAGGL